MNKILMFLVIFFGMGLVFLGLIFIMAYEAGMGNAVIGGVMLLVGLGMFAFVYYDTKIRASRPTLVNQTFNVKMEGSGQMRERGQMKCHSCGAPMEDRDLKVIQGGVMYTCAYCGSTGTLEEEPKW